MGLVDSVMALRFVNILLHLALVAVLYLRALQLGDNKGTAILRSLSFSLLPVLYFFVFLFYTDVLSTLLLALMFYCAPHGTRNYVPSALFAAAAVATRQTNIVWAFYLAATHFFVRLGQSSERKTKKQRVSALFSLSHVFTTVQPLAPFVFLGVGFVAFVKWNNGIVLGDKSNHVVVQHWAQVVYFFAFLCSSPFQSLCTLLRFLREIRSKHAPVKTLCALVMWCVVATYWLHRYTYAHLFVLSDNRHFPFYLWRRVLSKPFKYCLVPFAALGLLSVIFPGPTKPRGQGIQQLLATALYLFCVLLTVGLSPLIEFRYFIPAVLVGKFALGCECFSHRTLVLDTVVHVSVTCICLLLFLLRPFTAPDGSVGRFMW
eukprot:TRINITY_DN11988_c0_g2_i2.p1 TRINITY_DN11988_c0_g2~~TRINITY_DN11988_c0_g2_i2.p1  ORF type:complete len:374 (-),score=40.24 TRINITY_DN11988_c0_g2_i2:23-1144(-)